MAREAGLRIGLGEHGAGQHVGDGALARPCPADDGDVQRQRRLPVQKRPDAVAHQRRGEADFARMARLVGLPPAMLLQPGQIVAKLAGKGA